MSITSFQFARILRADLRDGAISIVDQSVRPYYRLTGRFDIGAVVVPIEIHVWQDFEVLKRIPPALWCHENWMRDNVDWHYSRYSGMCWILRQVWCDGMSWKEKSVLAILNEGRKWLVNDVRCLINRHYTGFREGLTDWPEEWPFWSHYNEGAREYEREKRRARKQRRGASTAVA